MEFNEDVLFGLICPYCGKEPVIVDSKIIYKSASYGPVLYCKDCHAWVGVHKSGKHAGEALGRLANDELRRAKKKAHSYFDELWMYAIVKQKRTKYEARNAAYRWLSKELDIPAKYCHIGMFDVETCEQVAELCQSIVKTLKR